jgi:hypothetical protein
MAVAMLFVGVLTRTLRQVSLARTRMIQEAFWGDQLRMYQAIVG